MLQQNKCLDPVALDLWHPLGALGEPPAGTIVDTVLLEERVSYAVDADGAVAAWRSRSGLRCGDRVSLATLTDTLPTKNAYGYIWTSLGTPPAELFAIPEYAESDRRRLNAASIGVNVSAPRAIENFLDMGHFPYVHTDILGAEPHTEVKEYDVELSVERDEIVATRCRFFQPMASTASTGGADVEYIYR
ncbi:aromatic ring-hydroxylating dioxygenase subunit alpha, partial [Sinorhizobium meliloti]|nr:aromatic ring-hydroxylating dioxygenase subunit alpha [Sinorhizobium meliloti]